MTSTAVKCITLLRGGMPYVNRVLATGPIALWPLSETSGTTARDVVGGRNGTYANVTLNAATFGDGTGAPLFDAANEVVQLPTTNLDNVFDKSAGTISVWLRVRSGSVWTDGTVRVPFSFGANANNRTFLSKSSVNNRFDMYYVGNGTYNSAIATWSPTAWFHAVFTWNTVADKVIGYLNGVAQGSPVTGLGTWTGSLLSTFTAIGNSSSGGGTNFWDGYIKYATLWNRVLTPAEVASLYVSAFAV